MTSQAHAPPSTVGDITPEWVTERVGERFGGRVVDLDATPIGTGQVADSARLSLSWDPTDAGPQTLVAKVTSSSDVSLAIARITRTYEIEVGFYTELASTLRVNVPACHWAAHDAETGCYGLLLDDLAPAVQGDQMRGCTVDEAALAIDEMIGLHVPRWGDLRLGELTWLHRRDPAGVDFHSTFLGSLVGGFLERYGHRLDDDVVALTDRFMPDAGRYLRVESGQATAVHGDFRTDNLMFGGPRVWVLDWQTMAIGDGVSDLSYFLGGSITTDDRRTHEEDLVRAYWRAVSDGGVSLSWNECWQRYRRHAFAGLIMAVGASMNVVRTDRGDEMFITMAQRAGRHALDLGAEELI